MFLGGTNISIAKVSYSIVIDSITLLDLRSYLVCRYWFNSRRYKMSDAVKNARASSQRNDPHVVRRKIDSIYKKHMKRKIQTIYKKHNPEKLADLGALMSKYVGKEDQLLKAIEQKYKKEKNPKRTSKYPWWIFVLKNDEKKNKFNNEEIDKKSLNDFKKILDGLAASIGGECAEVLNRKGQRQLVVRQVPGQSKAHEESNMDAITPTIEKMRLETTQNPPIGTDFRRLRYI